MNNIFIINKNIFHLKVFIDDVEVRQHAAAKFTLTMILEIKWSDRVKCQTNCNCPPTRQMRLLRRKYLKPNLSCCLMVVTQTTGHARNNISRICLAAQKLCHLLLWNKVFRACSDQIKYHFVSGSSLWENCQVATLTGGFRHRCCPPLGYQVTSPSRSRHNSPLNKMGSYPCLVLS